MERTHRWAERSLAARGRPDQAVFGIVQGGVDPELRRESVAAIAGAAVRWDRRSAACRWGSRRRRWPPPSRSSPRRSATTRGPRYLMGVGSPVDFFTAVERGIDLFDCVLPTRVARTGQVWTDAGRLNLRNAAFLDDPEPIDPDVRLRGLPQSTRAPTSPTCSVRGSSSPTGWRRSTTSTWTLELMRRLRASLADGSFDALRASIAAAFSRDRGAAP